MIPTIYFVLPCYNEAESLPSVIRELKEKINTLTDNLAISGDSRILFVDDGSSDDTWELISEAAFASPLVKGIRLKKNCGQQLALYAGLAEAKDCCDGVITMDADGQHDLDAIDEMLHDFANGYQVVCGIRKNRDTDTLLKLTTVKLYYFFMEKLGAYVMEGHADYRLASNAAIKMYMDMPKESIYLRGDFPRLPLPVSFVDFYYKRRIAGKSKFSMKKMLGLAMDGLISNGTGPAKKAGIAGTAFALAGIPFLLSRKLPLQILSAVPCVAGGILIFVGGAAYARHLENDKPEFEISDRT